MSSQQKDMRDLIRFARLFDGSMKYKVLLLSPKSTPFGPELGIEVGRGSLPVVVPPYNHFFFATKLHMHCIVHTPQTTSLPCPPVSIPGVFPAFRHSGFFSKPCHPSNSPFSSSGGFGVIALKGVVVFLRKGTPLPLCGVCFYLPKARWEEFQEKPCQLEDDCQRGEIISHSPAGEPRKWRLAHAFPDLPEMGSRGRALDVGGGGD